MSSLGPPAVSSRAVWIPDLVDRFISAMVEQVQARRSTSTGFKSRIWNKITQDVDEVLQAGRIPLTKQ